MIHTDNSDYNLTVIILETMKFHPHGDASIVDTLSTYDSVLIGRDPGYSCGRTEVYWMLYKNGSVTKCTRSIFVSDDGKDTVRTVRFSDDSARRVQELVDGMFACEMGLLNV